MRKILTALLALPLAIIPGVMSALALTRTLYTLEDWLHIELAGHTGPELWVIGLIIFIWWGIIWALLQSGSKKLWPGK
ncbi:MAG: hypothetical protein KA368_15345 [Acidobacteria bacterium]|nr:hypothetical protein [Acidobacteriota bacterium]